MSGRFVLESFDAPQTVELASMPAAPAAAHSDDIDAKISAAYEKGFRAGWDDCASAGTRDQTKIAEAFGRRLGEVSLSVEDMRKALLSEIEPLFEDILQKILPLTVQKSFLPRLLEEIRAAAEDIGSPDVEVAVCAEDLGALETLILSQPDLPHCMVKSDPALGLSQAVLRLGDAERQFDLGGLLDTIEEAFAEFADLSMTSSNDDLSEVHHG